LAYRRFAQDFHSNLRTVSILIVLYHGLRGSDLGLLAARFADVLCMHFAVTARDIRKLVFRLGMVPLGIGLGVGLAGSMAVNRLLRAELVQVTPWDPVTLGIASAVLIGAGLLGCFIPARRAMRVDPVLALRHE
jgi:putative ABC transport system permease protein